MIRIFTAFSGYDSQCMALEKAGIDYDLVGWSEIDRYAIAAHDAIFPQFKDRNYGDICEIDWNAVPDFDLFTYSSPCQDFSKAGKMRGGRKEAEQGRVSYGIAGRQSRSRDRNMQSWRMSSSWSPGDSIRYSRNGSNSLPPSDTITIGRWSGQPIPASHKTGEGFSWCRSWMETNTSISQSLSIR